MGRQLQANDRQLRRRTTKQARRAPYARILTVTEGSKTEPLYLEEICAAHRLNSANVEVHPARRGTAPIQVVRYAQQLFSDGDPHKGIRPRSFDRVYAVFDRDEHESYFNALSLAGSLDGKLRNDDQQPVQFKAVASVPSFELWLLLHYEDVKHPISRDLVMHKLRRYLPGYEKGAGGAFAATQGRLDAAVHRAQALAVRFSAYTAPEPFTGVHELVQMLLKLRS